MSNLYAVIYELIINFRDNSSHTVSEKKVYLKSYGYNNSHIVL